MQGTEKKGNDIESNLVSLSVILEMGASMCAFKQETSTLNNRSHDLLSIWMQFFLAR